MSGRTVIEPGVYHQDSGAVWMNLKIAQRTAGNGIDVWSDAGLLPAEGLGKAPLIQFGWRIWQQLIERRPIDGVSYADDGSVLIVPKAACAVTGISMRDERGLEPVPDVRSLTLTGEAMRRLAEKT
ncbi:MAG: hypothetical protein WB761_19545 [Solirubrobacteraceae bacterium]